MITVERPAVAPESLATRRVYDGPDTISALLKLYSRKCYLCETVTHAIQVDHRESKHVNPERTYDWTNLYPADSLCNARRQKHYPEGGLLFPADGDDAERRLRQTTTWNDQGRIQFRFQSTDDRDIAARNSAVELERLHSNEHGKLSTRVKTRELQKAIESQIRLLLDAQDRWRRAEDSAARAELGFLVQRLVADDAPYAGLLRELLDPAFR